MHDKLTSLPSFNPQVQQAKQRFSIIGNSPGLVEAVERALRVAPIDLSVLVTGESGAGKEFFPQIIHGYSSRKHARYIAVNCGAIPEGTIDSELFGHEKGAFTGAVDSRKGYFEEADGGTIFLDEVAELPLTTQARLLRVLESGEYIRVGSSKVQRTNIRIVAATNVDLMQAVAKGKFREDLFYRLSTVQIYVPPLRERGRDIRLLAIKFASDFSERYRVPPVSFTESAFDLMMHYRWPGNVRQLKNVIEQVSLFEASTEVDDNTLRRYLPEITASYMPERTAPAHSYERERDMLLGMVFKLQRRLDEMQQRLDSIDGSAPSVVPRESFLSKDVPAVQHSLPAPIKLPQGVVESSESHAEPCSEVSYSEVSESKPQTLEAREKEAIRQALMRNDGRRKAAAAELNISERTLYRKIKDYGLE